MNAIDTNILVYAHRLDNPWHQKARHFLESAFIEAQNFAIPYHCLVEFFGIVTNARIFKIPTTSDEALSQCANLLAAPGISILTESLDGFAILVDTLTQSHVTGSQVHDARVAAVCIENGVKVIYTLDRDFSRFAPLCAKNPFLK